jgi:hypothetical protein
MNVWEVTFEISWSYLPVGEFDEGSPETVKVVAGDYNSALETAKSEIAAYVIDAVDESDTESYVRDARLIEIKRGISIDAIAKSLMQPA